MPETAPVTATARPDRRTEHVLRIARTTMASGEYVLACAFTVIGPSLLICGWGGPLTSTAFRDGKHLVLTDRSLIIVSAARNSTEPTGVFATIPHRSIRVLRTSAGARGPVLRIDVAGHVLRIEFPRKQSAAFATMAELLDRAAPDASPSRA